MAMSRRERFIQWRDRSFLPWDGYSTYAVVMLTLGLFVVVGVVVYAHWMTPGS